MILLFVLASDWPPLTWLARGEDHFIGLKPWIGKTISSLMGAAASPLRVSMGKLKLPSNGILLIGKPRNSYLHGQQKLRGTYR